MISSKEILAVIVGATGWGPEESSVFAAFGGAAEIPAGRRLYYQGDAAQGLYLVIRGSFDCVKNNEGGNAQLLSTALPGTFCALPEAVGGGHHLNDLISREISGYFLIYRKNLLKLMGRSAPIACRLAELLAGEFYRIHESLEKRGPREKLIAFLSARMESFGIPGMAHRVEITQEQIAEVVGYTRETVNRHLKELEGEKRIALVRGAVEIPSLEMLLK